MIDLAAIRAASDRIVDAIVRTPTIRCDQLGELIGGEVWLKLDLLQATGAFKERGAANRIALLSPEERGAGVIAVSAGNHAQAVARHAALAGIVATIVMPAHTPATKVTRTARWGAQVVLHGGDLGEAMVEAHRRAEESGAVFVHPFDDEAVIAGQGTLALEVLEDAPALDALVVPVGGGGLLAGCSVVAAACAPTTRIYGVEVDSYPALWQQMNGLPVAVGGDTVAEGLAVPRPGQIPTAIARDVGPEILLVPEWRIESAIALLAAEAKVVAEGAGAAGVAGLLAHRERFRGQRVGIAVCGGNIDPRALANVLQRVMLRDGRLMRLLFDLPDRPGGLARIAMHLAEEGANIIEVVHHRLFTSPSVQEARVEIMIEARDLAHAEKVWSSLTGRFNVTRV